MPSSIRPASVFVLVCFILLGAATPRAKAAADLRVMSFNIRVGTARDGANRWDLRKGLVVDTIRNDNPDLLGLQESLDFQGSYLRNHLSGYGFVGVGAKGGTRGEYTAIMYKTSRFQKLDSGHFWMSETPDVPGSMSWDTGYARVTTWVKLRDRDNPSFTFVMFNTHWDNVSSEARRQSAVETRRMIPQIAPNMPVILTGDFNADQGFACYHRMVFGADNIAEYIDTYRALHPGDSGTVGTAHHFTGKAGDGRIDWILANHDFKVLQAGIDRTNFDGRYPSDHFPVNAVLSPVPEPASAALLGLGAAGLLLKRRKRTGRAQNAGLRGR